MSETNGSDAVCTVAVSICASVAFIVLISCVSGCQKHGQEQRTRLEVELIKSGMVKNQMGQWVKP